MGRNCSRRQPRGVGGPSSVSPVRCLTRWVSDTLVGRAALGRAVSDTLGCQTPNFGAGTGTVCGARYGGNRVYGAVYMERCAGRFLQFLRRQRPYLLMDLEILGNTRSDTASWCFQNTAHAVLLPTKPPMVPSGRQPPPTASATGKSSPSLSLETPTEASATRYPARHGFRGAPPGWRGPGRRYDQDRHPAAHDRAQYPIRDADPGRR